MVRLRLWLVMLPLVVAGTQGGTWVLDRFAPHEYETAELFSASNPSHELLAPAVAVGLVILLCAVWLLARVAQGGVRLPRWIFACLPLLVFALQEHLEYVIAHGRVPWTLVVDPTFVVGIGLQVPFAIAAYLLARLLVVVAVAMAARGIRRRAPRRGLAVAPPAAAPLRRIRLAATCRVTRGPPLFAA